MKAYSTNMHKIPSIAVLGVRIFVCSIGLYIIFAALYLNYNIMLQIAAFGLGIAIIGAVIDPIIENIDKRCHE